MSVSSMHMLSLMHVQDEDLENCMSIVQRFTMFQIALQAKAELRLLGFECQLA